MKAQDGQAIVAIAHKGYGGAGWGVTAVRDESSRMAGYELSEAMTREIVRLSLEKAGLTIHTQDAAEFFIQARRELEFLAYPKVRAFGRLLDRDQVRALGLRANTHISIEFIGILNEAGLIDPVEASAILCSTVNRGLQTARTIMAAQALGIDTLLLRASSGAAGPCTEAAALDQKSMPLTNAVLLPLASCDKLGQCFCLYQCVLTFGE